MTTIKDLYAWAVMNKVEDLPIGLKYQDAGGTYSGDTFADMGPDHEISVEEASLSTGTDKGRYLLLS